MKSATRPPPIKRKGQLWPLQLSWGKVSPGKDLGPLIRIVRSESIRQAAAPIPLGVTSETSSGSGVQGQRGGSQDAPALDWVLLGASSALPQWLAGWGGRAEPQTDTPTQGPLPGCLGPPAGGVSPVLSPARGRLRSPADKPRRGTTTLPARKARGTLWGTPAAGPGPPRSSLASETSSPPPPPSPAVLLLPRPGHAWLRRQPRAGRRRRQCATPRDLQAALLLP